MKLRIQLAHLSLATALLVFPTLACSGGGGGGSTTNPATTSMDVEPNDVLSNANNLGNVNGASNIAASGSIQGLGADQFDSFPLRVTENANLRLSVVPTSANSDVDLWVTSADGNVQARFEASAAGAPESGTFAATGGDTLYVVVLAFDADTEYELRIEGI